MGVAAQRRAGVGLERKWLPMWQRRRLRRGGQEDEEEDTLDVGCTVAAPCVHVVPHSHLDPGWRLSFAEYQPRAAQILERVLAQLLLPSCEEEGERAARQPRTFVWGDHLFLWEWLEQRGGHALSPALDKCYRRLAGHHHDHRQQQRGGEGGASTWAHLLRLAVARGQLELVGGGWVQHDEALTLPEEALLQLRAGRTFLRRQLNATVAVAWQIDPFGHGGATPALLSHLRYEGAVLNRVGAWHKRELRRRRRMEFWWGEQGEQVLAHVLHEHYAAPQGFDFENSKLWKDLVKALAQQQDDAQEGERGASASLGMVMGTGAQLERLAESLATEVMARARTYNSGHVLLLMGDDFRYVDARLCYQALDALLTAVRQLQRRNTGDARMMMKMVGYSTPSRYFGARRGEAAGGGQLPRVGAASFFPYEDHLLDDVWSGVYSSRPRLKRRTREASHATRAAVQLHMLLRNLRAAQELGEDDALLQMEVATLQRNFSLLLHHDAITGTARERVVRDYEAHAVQVRRHAQSLLQDFAAQLLRCQHGAREEKVELLAVFNPLGWPTSQVLQLPLEGRVVRVIRRSPLGGAAEVAVPFQVTSEWVACGADVDGAANSQTLLAFEAVDVAPMSLQLFEVRLDETYTDTGASDATENEQEQEKPGCSMRSSTRHGFGVEAAVVQGSQALQLTFTQEGTGSTMQIELQFRHYLSAPYEVLGGGAYVFRSLLSSCIYIWVGLSVGYVLGALVAMLGKRLIPRKRNNNSSSSSAVLGSHNRRSVNNLAQLLGCGGSSMMSTIGRKVLLVVVSVMLALAFVCGVLESPQLLSEEGQLLLLSEGMVLGGRLGFAAALVLCTLLANNARDAATMPVVFAATCVALFFAFPEWQSLAVVPHGADFELKQIRRGMLYDECEYSSSSSEEALPSLRLRSYHHSGHAEGQPPEQQDEEKVLGIELHFLSRVPLNRELSVRFSSRQSTWSDSSMLVDDGNTLVRYRYRWLRVLPASFLPLTAGLVMKPLQKVTGRSFSIIHSQPAAVAPLGRGGLELMLHRSLGQDDQKGLQEALIDSEANCASTCLLPSFATTRETELRQQARRTSTPLVVIRNLPRQCQRSEFAGPLSTPLPPSWHLLEAAWEQESEQQMGHGVLTLQRLSSSPSASQALRQWLERGERSTSGPTARLQLLDDLHNQSMVDLRWD